MVLIMMHGRFTQTNACALVPEDTRLILHVMRVIPACAAWDRLCFVFIDPSKGHDCVVAHHPMSTSACCVVRSHASSRICRVNTFKGMLLV